MNLENIKNIIKDKTRTISWLAVSLIFLCITFFLAPSQLAIIVKTIGTHALAIFLGYWSDRVLFPDGRPHLQDDKNLKMASWMRRSLLIGFSILAVQQVI